MKVANAPIDASPWGWAAGEGSNKRLKRTFPSRREASKPALLACCPQQTQGPAQATNAHQNVSSGFSGHIFVLQSM